MTDDFRTEPLESIANLSTGAVSIQLRGALDREARLIAARRKARESYGKPYGSGPHYQHGYTGQLLEMRRKGQRVRFFDMDTDVQVGPEQRNVAPAVAWALTNDYFSPELAAAGIFYRKD